MSYFATLLINALVFSLDFHAADSATRLPPSSKTQDSDYNRLVDGRAKLKTSLGTRSRVHRITRSHRLRRVHAHVAQLIPRNGLPALPQNRCELPCVMDRTRVWSLCPRGHKFSGVHRKRALNESCFVEHRSGDKQALMKSEICVPRGRS